MKILKYLKFLAEQDKNLSMNAHNLYVRRTLSYFKMCQLVIIHVLYILGLTINFLMLKYDKLYAEW